MSAANGAIDHVKSLLTPTPANDWVSVAVVSKGEYGVPAGLVFSYPCRSDGKGNCTVVEGVKLDAFGQAEVPGDVEGVAGGEGGGGVAVAGVSSSCPNPTFLGERGRQPPDSVRCRR